MKILTFIKLDHKKNINRVVNFGSIKALMEHEVIVEKGKELNYHNLCYRLDKKQFVDGDQCKVFQNDLIQKKVINK